MAIELCLETSGFVVQAIEAGWVDHVFVRRVSQRLSRATNPADDIMVKDLADELSTEQATAVWLVDVCGVDYSTAAAEMSISATDLARTVAEARRSIRSGLD